MSNSTSNFTIEQSEETTTTSNKEPVFSRNIDKHGFYTVPNNLVRLFKYINITTPEFLFLNGLYAVKGPFGINPKQATLANYFGFTDRWIRGMSDDLADKKTLITRSQTRRTTAYKYSVSPLEKVLAFHAKKMPEESHGGHYRMPKVFIKGYHYFKTEYELNPTHFLVLSIFFMYRETSVTAVTTKEIASIMGTNETTAKRSVWALKDKGLVTILSVKGSNGKRRNAYDVQPFIHLLDRLIIEGHLVTNSSAHDDYMVKNSAPHSGANSSAHSGANSSAHIGANSSAHSGANSSALNNEKVYNEKDNNKKVYNEKQKNPSAILRGEIEDSSLPMPIKKTMSKNVNRTIELGIDYKRIVGIVSSFEGKMNEYEINTVLQSIYENAKSEEIDNIHGLIHSAINTRYMEKENASETVEHHPSENEPFTNELIERVNNFINLFDDKEQAIDAIKKSRKTDYLKVADHQIRTGKLVLSVNSRYKNGIYST